MHEYALYSHELHDLYYKGVRVFIKVPYADKDYAKKLNAQWSSQEKSWYTFSKDKHFNKLTDKFDIDFDISDIKNSKELMIVMKKENLFKKI